jgi:hypothetical protein
MHQKIESRRESITYGDLTREIEVCVDQFYALVSKLRNAGFKSCADELEQKLKHFDEACLPPYFLPTQVIGDKEQIKKMFDKSGSAIADMHEIVWKTVEAECNYADHFALIQDIRAITSEVQKKMVPPLKKLGLDYCEFSSLHLELEAKLGLDAPVEATESEPRRRRQPKDPVKIEAALRDCLETTIDIRKHITNVDKQQRFDKIIGRISSALSNLPEVPALPDAPTAMDIEERDKVHGDRIAKLVSASAQAMKVNRWIREVDLFENEQSVSKRNEILRRFERLESLAKGKDPTVNRQ